MTPAQLADKVLQVEKGKEGYINGNINHVAQVTVPLLSSSGVVEGSIPAYSLDYQVESTRGKNHFFVKAIISQQKLFIYTIQCKQLQYFDLQPIMQEMLDSIVLIN